MIKVSHAFEMTSRRHRIVLNSTRTGLTVYCEGPWFEYDVPAFLVDEGTTYIAFTRFFEADLSVDVETPYELSEVT